MSQSKDKKKTTPEPVSELVMKPLEQVIHESMIPYSEFVIMDRALPRVEDGLKPVQRRVLYSMLEVGVTPDKPYRKSARIVGDCMGKYHPHGDRSIYDTMVRMAQSFNMREILVDGHGNYGSVDGDGAAAMRYTEARLSPISLELLRDIEKNTVSWSFNFDDTTKEPDMLPGRFPNLLVNGATGIAVGLATNIPTHNLAETIDATVAVIENKKITLEEVMQHLPAPDFSTGGYILKSSELKQIYETGKGKLILRAKVHLEEENGKTNIVITEIPYQVNKANMLQRIAKLKEDQTDPIYASISDIVDESDREGTRAVIKTKKDTNIGALLQSLYKNTDLQINFNVNMVAIAGGKPKQMNLLEILHYYIAYQKQVIFRRTQYDLDVSEKRAHILEGLLIAIQNIDEVIAIIKASKSVNEAKETLMQRFALSDIQAQAILDMRLSRLTNLEVTKLVSELESLHALIIKLKRILESDKLQYNLIKSELLEIKKSYPSPRMTQLLDEEKVTVAPSKQESEPVVLPVVNETPEEPVVVIYSAGNTIKAVPEKNYHLSQKEFVPGATTHDVPQFCLPTTTHKKVYLFTASGTCHMISVSDIPQLKLKERGVLLNTIVTNYDGGDEIVSLLNLDEVAPDTTLLTVTQKGMVKSTPVSEYLLSKQSFAAIKLSDGDKVVSVMLNQAERTLCLVTKLGLAISFDKTQITPIGRLAQGVKGISLSVNDGVVGACQFLPTSAISVFLQSGNAKVVKAADIPVISRGGKGSRIVSLKDKNNPVVKVFLLTKNISYVTKSSNSELTFVLNKKMSLEDKDGTGRNVLTTKSKSVTCTDVFEFVVLEDL